MRSPRHFHLRPMSHRVTMARNGRAHSLAALNACVTRQTSPCQSTMLCTSNRRRRLTKDIRPAVLRLRRTRHGLRTAHRTRSWAMSRFRGPAHCSGIPKIFLDHRPNPGRMSATRDCRQSRLPLIQLLAPLASVQAPIITRNLVVQELKGNAVSCRRSFAASPAAAQNNNSPHPVPLSRASYPLYFFRQPMAEVFRQIPLSSVLSYPVHFAFGLV